MHTFVLHYCPTTRGWSSPSHLVTAMLLYIASRIECSREPLFWPKPFIFCSLCGSESTLTIYTIVYCRYFFALRAWVHGIEIAWFVGWTTLILPPLFHLFTRNNIIPLEKGAFNLDCPLLRPTGTTTFHIFRNVWYYLHTLLASCAWSASLEDTDDRRRNRNHLFEHSMACVLNI